MRRTYTTAELENFILEETEKIEERCQFTVLDLRRQADGSFDLTYLDNAFCRRFPSDPVQRWTASFFAKTKTDIKRVMKDLAKHRKDDIARYKRGERA